MPAATEEAKVRETEHVITLKEEIEQKIRRVAQEGKERIREFLDKEAEGKHEVKAEVDAKADEKRNDFKRERMMEMQMMRGRRETRRLHKTTFLFPGKLEDKNSLKYKGEKIAAIVTGFFKLLREDLEQEPQGTPDYLPEGKVNVKILKKFIQEGIDYEISESTAIYFYELLKKLYEKSDISSMRNILPEDDLVRIYALDFEAGEKLFQVLREVAAEEEIEMEEYIRNVERELKEMGLGRFSLSTKLTEKELKRLSQYWRKIDEAKGVIRKRYLDNIRELQQRLANGDISQEEFDEFFENNQREYSIVIKKIEEALDSGNVSHAIFILHRWLESNFRELSDEDKKILSFPDESVQDFSYLLSKASTDMHNFLQGVAGFLNAEALGIEMKDFMNVSVERVAAKFSDWFGWEDGRLKFKTLELQESILKILHKYFSKVGISSGEEWRSAIDEQAMAILTRAIRLSLGNVIRAADEEDRLGGFLNEIARKHNVPLSEVKAQFKELISKVRMAFEDEVAAQAITHEGTRLILQAKLHKTDELQKLMVNFDGDRAIGVFGGFDKELIDIASRLFSEYIQFYSAQHGGKIPPTFFRALYTDERLVDFPDETTLRDNFRVIIRDLLRTSEELRKSLGVSSIDELEDWRIERAFRLGLGRSMLFEARAPAVMGVAESWEGFEDQLPILAFFGFNHQWKWGRGGENLETRLKWLFDLVFEEDLGGIRERLKPWVPSKVWKEVKEGKITTLKALEKAVNALGPDAKRTFREGSSFVFRDILREFSFADLISRAGWRMKILKNLYNEEFSKDLDKSIEENADLAYRRIISKWGVAFLFNLTDERVKKEIEEPVLRTYLGSEYDKKYLKKKIDAEKKDIFGSKKFAFRKADGSTIHLTPDKFVTKKRLFYEGKLLFWLLKRSPIGFLDVITRVVPELAELYEYEEEDGTRRLVGAHEYYFDDNFLQRLRQRGKKKEVEAILKFRLELSKYWDKARFQDLQRVAETWYALQKEGFKQLMREKRGDLTDEQLEQLWEREGKKRAEEVKNKLFAADFAAAQKLLFATQNLGDAEVQNDRNLEVYNHLSDRGFEGVLKRVIFGSDRRRGLVGYFEAQNLDFADSANDKLRLGKENLFINLADVWLNYKAKRVIPSTSESRLDAYFRRATDVGNMLFARNWGDNHAIMGAFAEALGKLDSAFKEIGRKGDTQKLEEVVTKILSLKPWLGGDKVTQLASYVIYPAMRYVQEDWRARLPFPFGAIARVFLGRKASLNRLIEEGIKTGFNDENIRQKLREFLKKGYYKEKHQKHLEKLLGVSTDFYLPKFAASVLFTLGLIILWQMLKKAFEEEEKEGGK